MCCLQARGIPSSRAVIVVLFCMCDVCTDVDHWFARGVWGLHFIYLTALVNAAVHQTNSWFLYPGLDKVTNH